MIKRMLTYVTVAFTLGSFIFTGYQVKAETVTEQPDTTYESEEPTNVPEIEESIAPEATSTPEESAEQEITPEPKETEIPSEAPSEAPLLSDYQGIDDNGNTAANKAVYMNVNTYLFGQMKAESEQRWYLTSAPAGKLTVYLTYQAESDIDLDLYLFQYDATDGTIHQVASSSCSDLLASNVERLSYICDEGYYFIAVSSRSGFDLNNKFTLLLVSSGKYDNKEADDAIEQRQIINGIPVSIEQTIDNAFDVDWVQFTVPQNKNIFGAFRNESEDCTYIMTLYDSNLNRLGTISQGQNFDGLFGAGAYFVKIESVKGANPDVPYSLTFTPYDNFNTRQKVSGFGYIKDAIENERDENWLEYTLSEAGKILFTLTNPSSKVLCVMDVCTMGDDGIINLEATINQGAPHYIELQSGTYYIRVRSVSGYDPNTKYTVNIEKYGLYEKESNDTFQTANIIQLGDTIKGTISHKQDIDLYKVYMEKCDRLTVSLTDIPAGCDFDVRIYNTYESCLIDSDNKDQQDEFVGFYPKAGWYYIKVFCDDGYIWSEKNYYSSSARNSYYTLHVE